jgi:hypothetical protein
MQAQQNRIDENLKATFTDYVLIRVESKFNDKIGSLHLSIDPKIIQDENTPDDEVPEDVINAEKNVRTSGIVVGAPSKLSPVSLYEKYEGTPKYAPWINHEIIKDAILRMPPKMRNRYGRNMYYPGNPVESFQKQPNIPEMQPGDTVHFEYSSLLAQDAYFDEDSRGEIYKIPYQSIYCYVRNGQTVMVNGWVFVESVTVERFSEHIIFINNKPQQNVGKVAFCSPFLDNFVPKPGDTCLFLRTLFSVKDWDAVNNSFEISGYLVGDKIYYPMKQWEIVAIDKAGVWETVNDFVTVKPETIAGISGVDTIIYNPNVPIQPHKPGQIFIPQGSNVQEKKKKIHNYGIGTCNGQRIAYGKSNFYLFMDELDVLFIHRKDVWGTFTEGDEEPKSYRHEQKFPELYLNQK